MSYRRVLWFLLVPVLGACQPTAELPPLTGYDDLVALFQALDSLGRPESVDGVPDYSRETMAAKFDSLGALQETYARFDTTGWSAEERVDYRLVGAHLAGMEFNHRIMKRWSRDPVFYGVIGWFNPTMDESLSLPRPPIAEGRLARLQEGFQVIPTILEQAKVNLTEMTPDMARLGIWRKEKEAQLFRQWLPSVEEHHPDLVAPATRVVEAIDDFRGWLEEQLPSLTGPSGIGIDNYNWLLKNVYEFPYTWEECVLICQRELERSLAMLKLEEHRNRNLPPLQVAGTVEEYQARQNAAKERLYQFVRENGILPQPDLMQISGPGGYDRTSGRNFFNQVTDRDPLPLTPHDMVGHAPDGIRQREWNQRAIPRGYDPYYISGIRAEALATGMEEILMHLGILDETPRSRELTYMLRLFRAVRGLADLRMHSNEFTVEEAMDFAIASVPYEWYEKETYLIWEEMDLYMRQPGYGMGYLMGSVQLEELIAEEASRSGEDFDLQAFMGDFIEAGMIPLELIGETMR
jgi:hypothetical protein